MNQKHSTWRAPADKRVARSFQLLLTFVDLSLTTHHILSLARYSEELKNKVISQEQVPVGTEEVNSPSHRHFSLHCCTLNNDFAGIHPKT